MDEIYASIEYLESLHADARFTDMGDGTILDNDTGLLWLKDANCFITMNFGDAMNAAGLLAQGACDLSDGSIAGDWRLPTKEEWEAFMSTVYDNPALVNTVGDAQWLDGDAFTEVQSDYYWSSTGDDWVIDWYYCADMASGDMDLMGDSVAHYIWPVRNN